MSLRTLKDIEPDDWFKDTGEIREAAIEWVKDCRYHISTPDIVCRHNESGLIIDERVNNWIIYFFNLTEEDLKENLK